MAEERFRGGEQRPSPTVFPTLLIRRIDEIFSDDIAAHLQTGGIAVELASHLRAVEAARST